MEQGSRGLLGLFKQFSPGGVGIHPTQPAVVRRPCSREGFHLVTVTMGPLANESGPEVSQQDRQHQKSQLLHTGEGTLAVSRARPPGGNAVKPQTHPGGTP